MKRPRLDFETYLQCLREIMAFPTVFDQPGQIDSAMCWCRDFLDRNLKGYRIYRDPGHNLIARPRDLDPQKNITYLSAHMDTADADPLEWDPPFAPFSLHEDDDQMVGRGVSDCKAGVAFQLFLARLAGTGSLALSNLIFTFTFKEEGAGIKTACRMGEDFGTDLPVSKRDTFFFVLENTMTVSSPPVFSFYTAERGNFVIRVSGTMDRLQSLLCRLDRWNPVSIRPEGEIPPARGRVLTQAGGHVCSVPRDENLLTRVIENARPRDLLRAGDESGFGVVPSRILKGQAGSPVVHHLVLSNRSFDTLEDVQAQLEGIPYTEVKPFAISQGMDFEAAFSRHPLCGTLKARSADDLTIQQARSIGASDATLVTRCMAPELLCRFYPIVMGPGTRSQRHTPLPRLTHGKNETFDKQTGEAGVAVLLSVLSELGHISGLPDR